MREGLLWYDADTRRSARQKIDDAARRYQERFGRAANCCHVHPAVQAEHPDLHIVADATVRPHHFLVRVADSLPPLAHSAARVARGRKGAA